MQLSPIRSSLVTAVTMHAQLGSKKVMEDSSEIQRGRLHSEDNCKIGDFKFKANDAAWASNG